MSEEKELEVYKQFRAAQEKYVYFMLAGAGASIAFAVTRTQDANLSWSQIPLAGAILCWALSFLSGSQHLNYVASALYANMELLRIQSGMHPRVGRNPVTIQAASEGIREALESNSERSVFHAKTQVVLLIAGAALYIVWHVAEMYLRRP